MTELARLRWHAEKAIENHRAWCRANEVRMPAELDAALKLFASLAANSRQAPPIGPRVVEGVHDDDVMYDTPTLLTYDDAAEQLSVSRRTVERLVSNGDLRRVTVAGRTSRIHQADLDAYLDRLLERADAR